MKLWVDDIRNAPDESWSVARTVTGAIRALHQFDTWEVISLDHDISHQVQIGTGLERPFPCEETFMPVAYYIAEKFGHFSKPPEIHIHSSNVVAGKEMQMVLNEYGIASLHKPMGLVNRLEMEI